MNSAKHTLQVLKQGLEFLEKGGYRSPIAWRWPLAFEDSPTCSNHRRPACHGAGDGDRTSDIQLGMMAFSRAGRMPPNAIALIVRSYRRLCRRSWAQRSRKTF